MNFNNSPGLGNNPAALARANQPGALGANQGDAAQFRRSVGAPEAANPLGMNPAATGQEPRMQDIMQTLQLLVTMLTELIQMLLQTMGKEGCQCGQCSQCSAQKPTGAMAAPPQPAQPASAPVQQAPEIPLPRLGGRIISNLNNGIQPIGAQNQLIPPPSQHIQTLALGNKPVRIGGDGSASAQEVATTANTIRGLYQQSPTFKNMIDSSPDPSFEVSVGKRGDNTSWGNSQGRLFLNINNISPNNNDRFQSLVAHEFAHASIDIGHGPQIEQIEAAVAREAS